MESTRRTTAAAPQRIHQRLMKNISPLTALCSTYNIDYRYITEERLHFTKQTVTDDRLLSSYPTKLRFLLIEQFTHLEMPVTAFQETDIFQIHQAHRTGIMAFHSADPRHDCV